jgi:hypothetical protein
VDARLLEALSDLDDLNKYNCCEFALRYLIQAIKNLKTKDIHSIFGDMLTMLVVSKEDQKMHIFLEAYFETYSIFRKHISIQAIYIHAIYLDMVVGRDMAEGVPRHSVVRDEDLRCLKDHDGSYDKLQVSKQKSNSIGE